ncbi:MAG: transketolase C-terminal domain-containing protein, partial [Pseudomonadota bacterium]
CKTVIGFGAPTLAGKEKCHGAPLGAAEIAGAREKLGWTHAPFEIPQAIYEGWNAKSKGAASQQAWNQTFDAYARQFPQDAAEFTRRIKGELPADWAAFSEALVAEHGRADKPNATRKSSKAVIEALVTKLPELLGGSADLGESNGTDFKGHVSLRHGALTGNYVNWGVREFGMSAALNGITLHGGLRPFGGTFLVFSDYARNAIRLSALMRIPTIYVYTHDSIALGEDGPTHQPVEHMASLRLIPNVQLWRPADAFETAVAWKCAIERKDGPSLLVLTRQNLAPQAHAADHAALAARGGYVLWEPASKPQVVIIATGSEVEMAVNAAKKLGEEGRAVRVVSIPCLERFWQQDAAYREQVLPSGIKRLAVEAGVTAIWRGIADEVIGVDTFGESAPYAALMQHFGMTVENIASRLRTLMA